eukprot:CAMPEP_0115022252 /NCGR_PEP_ID=MMETSP0216-20121206/31421_1 /TAXON_ID=223996 /ORGANISM="Protocruzia adherens, Strain Boccale" /LENGTH=244 /DNA_ID=CAMNT_0002394863 /DNA_START=1651 /DNA_END=2385 /DNA_ORIENTATION=-
MEDLVNLALTHRESFEIVSCTEVAVVVVTLMALPFVFFQITKPRKPEGKLQEMTALINNANNERLAEYMETHHFSNHFFKRFSNHLLLSAIIGGAEAVIATLVNFGFRPQPSQADPVVLASDLNNVTLLNLFIAQGCSKKSIDMSLIPAILKDHLGIARILLNRGADSKIMTKIGSDHMAHMLISPEMKNLLARFPEYRKRLAILHFHNKGSAELRGESRNKISSFGVMNTLPKQFTKEILQYV